MDTGTGRFRHWAQCAVAVIVQRKKRGSKNSKNSSVQQKFSQNPPQNESVFLFRHLRETICGFQALKAASVLNQDQFFFNNERNGSCLFWILYNSLDRAMLWSETT